MDTEFSSKEKQSAKIKSYSLEFKQEAARLLIIDGLNAPEVAQKLGVTTGLLYRWKSEHLGELEAAGGPKRGGSIPTEMSAETHASAAGKAARPSLQRGQ
jgi:transposase-like protein